MAQQCNLSKGTQNLHQLRGGITVLRRYKKAVRDCREDEEGVYKDERSVKGSALCRPLIPIQ
jgi:surface antigen